MAIEGISFSESGKEIKAIIDGCESESIDVKIINKIDTEIIINELKNTAFNDDIIVDATLSPVQQAVLTISLSNIDGSIVYHTKDISSNDGHFLYNIPNNLAIGTYLVTLKYNGNKYYNEQEISRHIEIQRREILCDFDSKMFYVPPNSTFKKTFKLIDKINSKYITNCQISYIYKDEIFNIFSNDNGDIDLEISIPNTNQNHCATGTVIYPITFYLDDSSSYLLKNTTIKLIIDKRKTITSVRQTGQHIQGDVVSDNQYVNYGTIEALILNNYKITTEIDSNGHFEIDNINVNNIIEELTSDSDGIVIVSNKIPTTIELEAQGSNIKVGDEISIFATVKDADGNIVTDGMVDFRMYNDDTKLVYRYADELDESGQALFIFYTSKQDTYTISATYKSIVTYEESKNKNDVIITVGE